MPVISHVSSIIRRFFQLSLYFFEMSSKWLLVAIAALIQWTSLVEASYRGGSSDQWYHIELPQLTTIIIGWVIVALFLASFCVCIKCGKEDYNT